MPESYLHVRCARRSYQKSGVPKYDIPSVVAGAAGPDILFYYLGIPSLAKLGQRLHLERCGPFLTALIRNARGDVQKGYTLGFLSHNAADSTIHPWVEAADGVHADLEQRIDSRYLLRDKGRGVGVPGDSAADLHPEKALELGGLLSRCIREVYAVHVPPKALAKAFRDFYRCKGWLRDSKGRKGAIAEKAERALGLKPGTVSGHLITGVPMFEPAELPALIIQAEDLGAELMTAAQSWWDGEIGPLELSRRVGSRNYLTGEPT